MGERKHFGIYWDDDRHADLMEKLEILAEKQERSKSATAIIALKEYVDKYWEEYMPKEEGLEKNLSA